jgi:hypothetical protein
MNASMSVHFLKYFIILAASLMYIEWGFSIFRAGVYMNEKQ